MGACDLAPPDLGGPGPQVLATRPADGDEGVARIGQYWVEVDRRLDPATVHRGTVRVTSGPARPLLSVRFDPVDVAIVAEPFRTAPLEPEVLYELRIADIRDLSGRALEAPFFAHFRTGNDLGSLPEPSDVGFAIAGPLLASRCASSPCHGPVNPASGLDLSSAEGIARTALGAPSRQVGVSGLEVVRGSGLFGMPIVDTYGEGAGRPASSYLLYKVLADPHVRGEPMPPPPDAPLSDQEIRLLRDWILDGAPLGPNGSG